MRFKPARLRREVQHEADLAGETARRETEAQQAELVARIREEAEAARQLGTTLGRRMTAEGGTDPYRGSVGEMIR